MTSPVTAADLLEDEREPFRWRMGIHPLDLANWLIVDDDRETDLVEIRHELDEHPNRSIVALPSAYPAACDLYRTGVDHLTEHHPALATQLDPEPPSPAEDHDPVHALRRHIQEDLVLLERAPDGWQLTAAVVAAPTAWDLRSKLGQNLDIIHAPVPRYEHDLAVRMRQFFDRLDPERPVWRANRSLIDSGALRIEPPTRAAAPDATITEDNVAARLWLRIEYQTLRRLPITDAIVFTIRILRQRLDTLAARPDIARRLLRGIDAVPPDVGTYKSSTVRYRAQIRAWVDTLS